MKIDERDQTLWIRILEHGPLAVDALLVPKISKRHFFQDIKNSIHGVTRMGLEPHQKFWQLPAYVRKNWPILYECTRKFQSLLNH